MGLSLSPGSILGTHSVSALSSSAVIPLMPPRALHPYPSVSLDTGFSPPLIPPFSLPRWLPRPETPASSLLPPRPPFLPISDLPPQVPLPQLLIYDFLSSDLAPPVFLPCPCSVLPSIQGLDPSQPLFLPVGSKGAPPRPAWGSHTFRPVSLRAPPPASQTRCLRLPSAGLASLLRDPFSKLPTLLSPPGSRPLSPGPSPNV